MTAQPPTPTILAEICGLSENPVFFSGSDRELRLRQQLLALNMLPEREQDVILHEFAALYLPALTEAFRSNSGLTSTSVLMLNTISHTPYFSRFLRSESGKGLAAIHAHRMAVHPVNSPLQGEELGEAVQFFSTLMVYQGTEGISEEDKKAIPPKLMQWRRNYVDSGQVLVPASDRCRSQLSPSFVTTAMCRMMKAKLEKDLYECALEGCSRRRPHGSHELPRCGRCKVTIYCGQDHQKQDWPAHKKVCFRPAF